ncbi:MAG TPA: hypothetical protein VN855_00550 [Candidatus Acidoferrum sp.]|nr:hypothetical protein [Candidatus Acidoferrum sp.]
MDKILFLNNKSAKKVNEMTDSKNTVDKKLALDPKFLQIAKQEFDKFGTISAPLLMRKLKCSYAMACRIRDAIE